MRTQDRSTHAMADHARVFVTVILITNNLWQADLYAGAIFIEQSLNWDLYVSVVLLLAIAALFTITGKDYGRCCRTGHLRC